MRYGFGGGVVGVEHFDGFVTGAGEELAVFRPAHSFDNVLMRLDVPYFFSARQIPDFDYAVATATCKSLQGLWVLGYCVNAVDVAPSKLGHEWGREHALELDGIECSSVFPCSLKWVEGRIKVSRLAGDTRSWGLM